MGIWNLHLLPASLMIFMRSEVWELLLYVSFTQFPLILPFWQKKRDIIRSLGVWGVQFWDTGLSQIRAFQIFNNMRFLCYFFPPRNSNLWGQEQTHSRKDEALTYWNVLNGLHIFFIYIFLPLYKALYLLYRWVMGPGKVNYLVHDNLARKQ